MSALAQTFEVGQDAPANTKKQKKQEKKNAKAADSGSAQEAPSIGWGAGLEVAREAKAAQEAYALSTSMRRRSMRKKPLKLLRRMQTCGFFTDMLPGWLDTTRPLLPHSNTASL